MQFRKKVQVIVNTLLIGCLFAGCSMQRPSGKTEAEVLYIEAQDLIKSKRYILAADRLNQIKSKYPYSYYATSAELTLADILYNQEKYVEAAASYILFRDFHPKYKNMSYVVWKTAESYFKQLPSTFDRDLSSAHEAIKYYYELKRLYPKSSYNNKLKDKVEKCKKMIIDREQYIADFYFRTEKYSAAIYHNLYILSKFKNKKIRSKAMIKIIESSLAMKKYKECVDYSNRFMSYVDKKFRLKIDKIVNKCKK